MGCQVCLDILGCAIAHFRIVPIYEFVEVMVLGEMLVQQLQKECSNLGPHRRIERGVKVKDTSFSFLF